ncbi:hypothetical protein DSO57_1013213 [Entomophthora muscae]|uniref:Uncharacterized protein n=1 Tax=Entomophthora muscae TaxID=34485 RepID=A0ACC2RWS2_9FUNG|nr:hypothetical protein DSO57_1013213 [Entomophthora muscae]
MGIPPIPTEHLCVPTKLSKITSKSGEKSGQARSTAGSVATEFPDLPANVSYNTQEALDESSLDVSNNMNQSNGNVK